MMKPEFYIDKNLRDIPCDVEETRDYLKKLEESLDQVQTSADRAKILGEIGAFQRLLGELDCSEHSLREDLQIVKTEGLGTKFKIQQKIRLAHTLQWQKKFEESNVLFSEILSTCRNDPDASFYLDFALQHAAKNLYDQEKWAEALKSFEEALILRKKGCLHLVVCSLHKNN